MTEMALQCQNDSKTVSFENLNIRISILFRASNFVLRAFFRMVLVFYTNCTKVNITAEIMSSTLAPLERSVIGFANPCRNGPTALASAIYCVSL